MSQENTAPAMSAEQAADLAALQAAAAGGPESAGMAAEVAAPDPAAEMVGVISLAVGLLSPMLPYLPGIYTEERNRQLAAAWVALAAKHGWQTGGWFERYGEEIMAAAVVIPTAAATIQAHKAFIAAKAPKPKAVESAPVEAAPVGSASVHVGAAIHADG